MRGVAHPISCFSSQYITLNVDFLFWFALNIAETMSFISCCYEWWTTVEPRCDTQCASLPEGGLGTDLCQVWESLLADIDPLGLSADLDDLQTTPSLVTRTDAGVKRRTCRYLQTHLLHLLWCVQHGAYDHDSVQQVQRDAVWRADVLCPPSEQQMIVV